MRWLTEEARVVCAHEQGIVGITARQELVFIEGKAVLVATDPEGRPIVGCPNIGATIKPCTQTLKVREGYSDLLQIDGREICLDTVVGLTDGTPPGIVEYKVRQPGQELVEEQAPGEEGA